MGRGASSKLEYGREFGDYGYQAPNGKKTKKKPSLSQIEKDEI
jgi:hypothetical protein